MTILEIFQWLEGTWPAVMARESPYGFQFLVTMHLLGVVFSVGTLLWFDLRLMGVGMQRCGVPELYRGLAPWFVGGFVAMLISGTILLAGFATAAYGNLFFRIKMVTLALAGVNAVVYHFTARAIPEGDEAPRLTLPIRLAGLTSLVLWGIVIVAGRMMSYTMF